MTAVTALRMVVAEVVGHSEVAGFGATLPRFLEVRVTARNSLDESVEYRVPLDQQPRVGDVVDIPEINQPDTDTPSDDDGAGR